MRRRIARTHWKPGRQSLNMPLHGCASQCNEKIESLSKFPMKFGGLCDEGCQVANQHWELRRREHNPCMNLYISLRPAAPIFRLAEGCILRKEPKRPSKKAQPEVERILQYGCDSPHRRFEFDNCVFVRMRSYFYDPVSGADGFQTFGDEEQ